MKHILFIVTSTNVTGTGKHKVGYEFSEVADPYWEFIEKGMHIDFASIAGGEPPFVGFDGTHESSRKFKESAGFKRMNFSHQLAAVDIDSYDAVFFPGGLGPMTDMVNNLEVKEAIRQVYESGRLIGAVCHGPVALLNIELTNGKYLVSGKHVSSFTQTEEEADKHLLDEVIPFLLDEALMEQGGIFSCAGPFEAHVVRDGNLITGQNPASATGVAREMIKALAQ